MRPAYSPPPLHFSPPMSPLPGPSVSDQLQKLAQMHSRGDLTDDEFAAAKRRILAN